jgi:hypothetical protein
MPVVCWLYNSLTRSSTSWMQHQHYLGHLISTQAGKYLASGKRKRYHALPLSVVQAAAAELQPLLEAAQAHLDSRQPGNTINENDTSWISPDQQQIATRVSSNLAGLSTAPLACLSSSDQQDILLRTFKAGKLRSFGSSGIQPLAAGAGAVSSALAGFPGSMACPAAAPRPAPVFHCSTAGAEGAAGAAGAQVHARHAAGHPQALWHVWHAKARQATAGAAV